MLTYLEGNATVVWIFRSWYQNFFWLASLLSALPAHLVSAHTWGGGGHPSHLPGLLVHLEVSRGKGPGGEAARQRGGGGLRLTAKGGGQVLHLILGESSFVKQARKLGRCDSYLRNLKTLPTDPPTD